MNLRELIKPSPECIGTRDTLAAAIAVMRKAGVSALPVYDHNEPVGLLTQRDLENWREFSGDAHTVRKVCEAMKEPQCFVRLDLPLEAVSEELKKAGATVAAVIDGGKIVGTIESADLENKPSSV